MSKDLMVKFARITLIAAVAATQLLIAPQVSQADDRTPLVDQLNSNTESSSVNSGLFSRPANFGVKSMALSTGSCFLQATNVHMASSIPGSIAADALVTCTGTSIKISSMSVILYKSGLIPHYLAGYTMAGTATPSKNLQYNDFKTLCSNQTISTYWSKVVASGTYADGSPTYATHISPVQSLSCGTFF